MTIKAALLDGRGVFLRIVTLPNRQALTPRHVESITECDLPPGKYRWIADANNAFGGAFWPIAWLDRGVEIAAALAYHNQLMAARAANIALPPDQQKPPREVIRAERIKRGR